MQHQKNQSSNSRPVDSPELTSTPYFPAEFRRYPHSNHMQMHRLIILCFLFTSAAAASVAVSDEYDPDQISINCGGASPVTALDGRRWSGDVAAEGSSTASTVKGGLIAAVDSIPYKTARVSRSRFSYSFRIDPGQKFIRLHFNPSDYYGFESFDDLFTVEAGSFVLLANFSASITACALSVNVVVKEFCMIVRENQPFNIVFSPEISGSSNNYAFVNGIEIISVPSTVSYCHGGDSGIRVLGQKSLIYVDFNTVLERVYHQNMKGVSVLDDIGGMFRMWASNLRKHANKGSNLSWGVPVDVGFRYLFRIHLREVGHKMDFMLLIDNVTALTSADMLKKVGNQSIIWYNYMVMVEGLKREGKRVITISLNSRHEFLDGHGALEGFEVFKLSNHDRSLASPNPVPLRGDSPSYTIKTILYSLLGRRNAIATAFFTVICLVNISIHLLHKMWVADDPDMAEEEDEPLARTKRLCRQFSLAEIQSATENFHDGYVIGKGGFGKVYKGFIDDRREIVAIKRSKPGSKDFQFWTEIETLSELRHVNLVSLIGYCIEQQEMIIVYEFMVYGSLADHLYKLARKSTGFYPLTWKQRLKICIEASRALDYLHTGHGIIHRDVKSSNILLDEKLVAKVSDFGLAKTGTSSESQSQESTNLKGTFGYIDPDYFRTRKLTKKSDTYSFGVVLLEVLCGRRAVESSKEEDERSLTMWATDNISKGQVMHIVAPSLRGEISKDSLNTFLKVAERCLHTDPKKRPSMVHIVIKLELALLQQERAESLSPTERTNAEDVFSSTEKYHEEKKNILEPYEKINVDDALPQKEKMRSPPHNEIRNATDTMPYTDNDLAILSVSARPMATSFNVKNDIYAPREQSNTTMINSERKHEKKSMMHRISQKLWPMDAFWKTRKSSNKKESVGNGISVSAPVSHKTEHMTSHGNNITNKGAGGASLMVPIEKINDADDVSPSQAAGVILPQPSLTVFTFAQLKAATRNFKPDSLVGEGGFGRVYKGWIDEESSGTTVIAVKRLDAESMQGYMEWQSEINFLGRLSHPNLVKLLGYCWEGKELLLVYEYVAKGSLENHLFNRLSYFERPLPWDIRLKIMIGAARGMAFLHASENQVIYRDFKASNILLEESYHAKLSDFGLAKIGPTGGNSHVSTQVMGTHGYAAPEYIATGHLYVKSDVYGFGVVLLEMLAGFRAIDRQRPHGQQNLVEWMKPLLCNRRKLKHVIDRRLEGTYRFISVVQIAQLTFNCLQPEPRKRPSMQEIVDKLEEAASANRSGIPSNRIVHFSHKLHL